MKIIRIRSILALIAFNLFLMGAISQSPGSMIISGKFRDQALNDILNQIESDHAVRFYVKQSDVPQKKYTITFDATTLETALADLLRETGLSFIYYRDFAIVILPRMLVDEVYTSSYYETLERSLSEKDSRPSRNVLTVGDIKLLAPSGKASVSGYVISTESGEAVIGATVLWPALKIGTATDDKGFFQMVLPAGQHELLVQYIGFQDFVKKVKVLSDGQMEIELIKQVVNLDEVTVKARRADASVENVQISVTSIDAKAIKKVPTFLGEADVIKSLLLNPGVSTVGEGGSGFNVRGGEVDQNLIMQDEGFIFNSAHALGFFSTFNPDILKKVDLYKGNIPAQYGGRIASVMNVEMRDGNFQDYKIKAGIGPVISRVSFEGPVVKDKSSFIAGLRSTYSNWILKRFNVRELNRSSVFFYDLNARYTNKLNEKNTITLAVNTSKDEFIFDEEFGFDYNSLMGQLFYNRVFSDELLSKFSATFHRYESSQQDLLGLDAAQLDNNISYVKVKEHLIYASRKKMKMDFGLSSIYYLVEPGKKAPFGDVSQVIAKQVEDEKGLESALFLNAEYELSDALLVSGGLRLSGYQYLGPKTVFSYEDASLPDATELIDKISHAKGKVIASYWNLEPRVSMRYRLSEDKSIKAGYSRTVQYINQIFNSATPVPSSLWQLSTSFIKPHKSHNLSMGYFQNFENNNWETSAEVFYRHIDQLFDYKDFAELFVNTHLETELLPGRGRAYGFELSIKRKTGVFNGWLSYTYAKTEKMIEGINKKNWFPSNFDRPHDASLILNYQPNRRNTLTFSFSYSTGRPTTAPIGNFETESGQLVSIYTDRNQVRIPSYHRMDVAYTLGKGYKKDKKIQTSWTISVYNIYGRKNAFSVFFTRAAFQQTQANKLSILGSAFPTFTFNLEIL